MCYPALTLNPTERARGIMGPQPDSRQKELEDCTPSAEELAMKELLKGQRYIGDLSEYERTMRQNMVDLACKICQKNQIRNFDYYLSKKQKGY